MKIMSMENPKFSLLAKSMPNIIYIDESSWNYVTLVSKLLYMQNVACLRWYKKIPVIIMYTLKHLKSISVHVLLGNLEIESHTNEHGMWLQSFDIA